MDVESQTSYVFLQLFIVLSAGCISCVQLYQSIRLWYKNKVFTNPNPKAFSFRCFRLVQLITVDNVINIANVICIVLFLYLSVQQNAVRKSIKNNISLESLSQIIYVCPFENKFCTFLFVCTCS